jgi:hypothetical protein
LLFDFAETKFNALVQQIGERNECIEQFEVGNCKACNNPNTHTTAQEQIVRKAV